LLVLGLLYLVRPTKRLTLAQLRDLATRVGFPDPTLAAAVAMAESGGNAGAVGDVSLGRSIGLWQINLRAHPQYSELGLVDPTTNARAALAVSRNGVDWSPWTTFRNGDHLRYMGGSA
jgi:hypothetical protein